MINQFTFSEVIKMLTFNNNHKMIFLPLSGAGLTMTSTQLKAILSIKLTLKQLSTISMSNYSEVVDLVN